MQINSSFIAFDNKVGKLYDQTDHKNYPLSYYNVIDGEGLTVSDNYSYYGFVYEGDVGIDNFEINHQQTLVAGMYFSFSGNAGFNPCVKGKAIVIEVNHNEGIYPLTKYKATNVYGGPIEEEGRLKYIDGCTDSLLIPPVKLGDPCFNHLHFPPNITQTPHTHPSDRIGIVSKGYGECVTPFGNLPLTEGMIFVIREWDGVSYDTGLDGKVYPNGTHKFNTQDSAMDVIAFHPDSDFGATDIVHPMINRTIVDGVSASKLEDIRTK
tara:strand:- start:83 stop:880 length:798 start_codon:yes stop_codon:yes gene_type:complete